MQHLAPVSASLYNKGIIHYATYTLEGFYSHFPGREDETPQGHTARIRTGEGRTPKAFIHPSSLSLATESRREMLAQAPH